MPAETTALWHIYGVNVVEMYGKTEEAGGIVAGQRILSRAPAVSARRSTGLR